MTRIQRIIALIGTLSIFLLGGFAVQEKQADAPYPTGLIPLDAEQINEIIKNWPRITKVNVNWLGFERINKSKVEKGKPPLDPLSIKPVGREVESSIREPGVVVLSIGLDPDLAGDLPVDVDNSLLKFFPPIRSQGSLGSCVSFASTYTQLSYMTAFQRDLDIRDNDDNTNKYSPKWTYNMINGGSNDGSYFSDNFELLENHGACTWAEFPYDNDYRAWCLSASAWRNALNVRANPTQYVWGAGTDPGLEYVKELLANGYVLLFGTYINSWMAKLIQDDPSTPDDDPEVGQYNAYWLNGDEGSHAMVIVGYNDAIWSDINGNGSIEPGEKGAFRIANSWGNQWWDQGFAWLAYDALRSVSAVPGGPSAGRVQALQGDMAYVLTLRDAYSSLMIAEFTVNHAKRDQLKLTLGRSAISATVPTTVWTPAAFQNQGGAYAFDGSTTAVDGTFVLDFSDILVEGGGPQRYFLGMSDNASGDPAALSALKIVDLTTDPDTEAPSLVVPKYADGGQQVYAYVDYAYSGPAYNHPPRLSSAQATPGIGTTHDTYSYFVYYHDQDGDVPTVKRVAIDGSPHTMAFDGGYSASDGWYQFDTGLSAGSHDFSFYFEDGRGESAGAPIVGAMSGPEVFSLLLAALSPSSAITGSPALILSVTGSDFVDGAVVRWDGSDRPTAFINSSRVDAEIGAEDLVLGKTVQVTVRDPGGGISSALEFTINNPLPSLTSISPVVATGGGAGFALTLLGSNFVPNSAVEWNGSARATTFVSDTELLASIPAADIAAGGEFDVTIANPSPAGGDSGAVLFRVSGFGMSSLPASATVTAGQTATYTIQVAAQFGTFNSPVSVSCTGLPARCTASFSPASVTPGATAATTTLILTTKARQNSGVGAMSGSTGLVPPALGLLLFIPALLLWFLFRHPYPRRFARHRLAAGALICLVVLLSGCGAGEDVAPPVTGTPAGTYPISVQGTSGNLTVSTTLTLVVK